MILQQNPYPEHDPYEVLGVSRDADRKTVARANRERMKDLDRNDPLYQRCQTAKEVLTKPRARMRIDLATFSSTGWLAELDERYWGRTLDLDLSFSPELVCLFSDLDHPAAREDFADPAFAQPKLSIVESLAWDPARDRIGRMGA